MNTTNKTTMKVQHTIAVLALGFSFSAEAKITKKEYVESWAPTAMAQMESHGIPASITLAQGILESGSGNSMLAVKAKNHFGIKCHKWTGKKIYKDDDKKGECFRVYKNADESYADHSDFLTRYSRYDFLFDLKKDDYKAWAKGLKKAGYATNPKYPSLLIGIIEDLELYKFDNINGIQLEEYFIADISEPSKENSSVEVAQTNLANTHQVNKTQGTVQYIVAKKGDTYYRIAKEFDITLKQLYKYNDVDAKKDILAIGDRVYISKKKGKNWFKKEEVVLNERLSVNQIAQKYGVNAKNILDLNSVSSDEEVLAKGEKVILR